jgi:DNA-binding SARP family transcriptional activator
VQTRYVLRNLELNLMEYLQFKLLGGFTVQTDGGRPLLANARKARALLAYLAMLRGRPVTRSHLAHLLWGSHGDEQARASLRQTLYVIRTGLGDYPGLRSKNGEILLEASTFRADVLDLEDLANGDHAGTSEIDLNAYTGVLMDGFRLPEPAFEEWLEGERRRFRGLIQIVLRGRLAPLEDTGRQEDTIATAQLLLVLDPLQEDIHRTLMSLYMAAGRSGDAARQYDECRDVLRRELALVPDQETERLIGAVRANNHSPHRQLRPAKPPFVNSNLTTVAVLPFSGEPAQRANHLTSEITHTLSAWRHLAVIDRRTMITYGEMKTTAMELADELGAKYVIEGETWVDAIRIQARVDLVDAQTGRILWSEKYTRTSNKDTEAELVLRMGARTAHEIDQAEWRRTLLDASGLLLPWQYFQRGCALSAKIGLEANRQSQQMFRRALEIDPTFTPATAALAQAYHQEHECYHGSEDTLERCLETARFAVESDSLDATAHVAMSLGALRKQNHRVAIEEGLEAVRLNPSNAKGHVVLGNALSIGGEPLASVARVKQGLAQTKSDDHYKSYQAMVIARSYLVARNHGAAVKWAEKSTSLGLNIWYTHFVRASALSHLQRWSEGEAAIAQSLAVDPQTVDHEFNHPASNFTKPADYHHILDGVRQLGFG